MTKNKEENFNFWAFPSGIRLVHCPTLSHIAYTGIMVGAGSRDEEPAENGMAHFIEHALFKGTTSRSAKQIINHIENVGGEINAYTTKEETAFYAATLPEHIGRTMQLLADMVFHPAFPKDELLKERQVIYDEIESYNDSPAELIYDDFENILFEGHPLGHNILGNAERVRKFTTEDALRFARKYYTPENSIFFAYGDVEFEKLVRLLEKEERGEKGEERGERKEEREMLSGSASSFVIREKGTHQAHVMLGTRGYDILHPLRIPLYLLNNLLGGPGMNARLNISLRERNGLVYTVESTMVSYGDTGLWGVYFGCDPHDVKCCLRLVRRELDKIIEKPLTDSQLKAAKRQLKGQIGIACDNREQFALDFGKSFLHYGWEKDITSLYSQIEEVTAEQIQQVARELMSEDRITTLIYK